MSCRVIALSFGYVESSTTSWLIFSTEDGHSIPTRREALHSFVAYLYDKFQKDNDSEKRLHHTYKTHMATCCQRAWTIRDRSVTDPISCPTCNASYVVGDRLTFSVDDWINYLEHIRSSDANSYGEHDWPDNPERWSPWCYNFDVPANEVLVVQEQAGEILTMALADIHPELQEILESGQNEEWPDINDDNYLVKDYHKLLSE